MNIDLTTDLFKRGFALPAVLIVACASLLLAVGMLAVVGVERKTARSFVDHQRAEMAASAALEEVKRKLFLGAANDDYFILHGEAKRGGAETAKEPAPYLYVARGSIADSVTASGHSIASYHHIPLFSHATPLSDALPLRGPSPEKLEALLGDDRCDLDTLPWQQAAEVSWLPVHDAGGVLVARYAYWVEDLQGKIDAKLIADRPDGAPTPREQAGEGSGGINAAHRHPAPGTNANPLGIGQPAVNGIAFDVLDPASGDEPSGELTRALFEGRASLLSPDAILGATGFRVCPDRDPVTGLLEDPIAAALEKAVSPAIEAYEERPLIPYADGISKASAGMPKLNLNRLLGDHRSSAVEQFAGQVKKALPGFERRKGGFPDDYLKTLAANAFDYADEDHDATLGAGYRGVDSYPQLSELVLLYEYLGMEARPEEGRNVFKWRFRLFGELWNMTNKPFSGKVALSYEVDLQPSPLGAESESFPFDSVTLLGSKIESSHHLIPSGDRDYRTPDQDVDLLSDQYRFFEFADVHYTLSTQLPMRPGGSKKMHPFDLSESEGSRGIRVYVNGRTVQHIRRIIRDGHSSSQFHAYDYGTNSSTRWASKAAIPGHSYGSSGAYINNMGDPRMSHYFHAIALGENGHPENSSPGRRNLRRQAIYDKDSAEKRWHYGRVMPSEWPDGGHDSPVGDYLVTWSDSVLPTDTSPDKYPVVPTNPANAPQRISNAGRFFSPTELGHVYDPVMWRHAYDNAADTDLLMRAASPMMPSSQNRWPDVGHQSAPSPDYGGGNTLRIGRPEHPQFDRPGERAAHLLDLFHAGRSTSGSKVEREDNRIEIRGRINVNTAGEEAIRAMAAGWLKQDEEVREVISWEHLLSGGIYAPRTARIEKIGTPSRAKAADRIAEAILRSRPFASAAELAVAKDQEGMMVFGNRGMYANGDRLQWSDAAAEEVFARVYDASTLRSRNFRVWVVGQAVAANDSEVEILGEARKVYTVFADPGERSEDGSLNPDHFKARVIHKNRF